TPGSAGAPDERPFAAGRAEKMPFAGAQFDAITFWHSLEHTLSPHTALAEAWRLLRPAGRLLLEVPNLDSRQARVFGRWWVHLDVPRHRCNFTPAALRRLLQDAGYIDAILRSRPSAVGWERSIHNWASAQAVHLPAVLRPLVGPLAHLAAGLEQLWGAGGGIWVSARPAPAPAVRGGPASPAPPLLSVIIVSWNCWPALERCLESLRPALAGVPAEIIAVDNGSTDGTVERLCRQAPDVRVLAFPENLGYAAAANRAVRLARGEYLWFLNPDAAVAPDAVAELLKAMAEHPRAGAAGPQLLRADGKPYPLSARRFPTLWTELLEKTGLRGASFSRLALLLGDETAEVPAVSGAAVCMRRPAWEEVGGFDERYFLYAEDMDICQALRAAGWKVYYVGRARVMHQGGGSSAQCPEEAGIHALVSLLRYFRKHHGRPAGHAYRWMITLLSLMKMAVWGPAGLLVPAARAKAALQRRVLRRIWQESMIG
ncbi:MAG: glycosyltransferase, partial [Anaerolineae bacterium]